MLIAIGLVAVAAELAAATAGENQLTCGMPIAWDASEASLKQQFGSENVAYEDIGGPEGTERYATVIHRADPSRMLTVVWADADTRSKPQTVFVNPGRDEAASIWTFPVWVTAEGIKGGMTIAEVEALNGKPFILSGFGGETGGSARSWEGGKLEQAEGAACLMSLTFLRLDAHVPVATLGDGTVRSDAADVRASKPVVGWYSVTYRRPPTP